MHKRGLIKFFVFAFFLLMFFLFAFLKSAGIIEITGYTAHNPFSVNSTEISKIEVLEDGNVVGVEGSFHKFDFLGCAFDYSGATGGVVLDVGFYSDIHTADNPNVVYANAFGASPPPEEFLCDSASSTCLAYYNVTSYEPGNWKCFVKYGSNLLTSDPLRMINSPPVLTEEIPDVTLNLDGSYIGNETLDLNDYFEDFEGDEVTYGAVGQLQVIISVDDGVAVVNNPDNYEGVEIVKFRAHDGVNGTFSNDVRIIVGSGVADDFEVCTPIWDCRWGECINSAQSCDYFDRSNCGDENERPENLIRECESFLSVSQNQLPGGEIQLTGTLEIEEPLIAGKQRSLIYIGVAVLVVLLVGFGVFLLVRNARKAKAGGIKGEFKPAAVQEQKPAEQTSVNQQLADYVENALGQNQDLNKIKTELINVGWNNADVEQAINFIRLKKFVKSKLDAGFSKEIITNSLKSKGWKDDLINKIFSALGKK